jgi:electron-transferring-flavoprotein dehydrogenase
MWLNTALPGVGLGYTLKHRKADHATLRRAERMRLIRYPKPDGVLTFDRLTNLSFSGTNHEEDQPSHLKVADMALHERSEHDEYAGPSNRYCPAGVYEWMEEPSGPRYVINAQNCVHCKTCDVKDPNQNITWIVPEGGGGPNYSGM